MKVLARVLVSLGLAVAIVLGAGGTVWGLMWLIVFHPAVIVLGAPPVLLALMTVAVYGSLYG